jgi:hypothetical protein
MLDELQRLLRRRSKHFEYLARVAITVELTDIYRAKAAEAYSIYVIIENMKKKMLKERAQDAEITDK